MTDVKGLVEYWRTSLEVVGLDPGYIPVIETPPERTWLWSDLHLSDRGALENFGRPFADVVAMNRQLLAEWQRLVVPDDTIICLGDVAHPDAWRDPRLTLVPAPLPRSPLPRPRQSRHRPRRTVDGRLRTPV